MHLCNINFDRIRQNYSLMEKTTAVHHKILLYVLPYSIEHIKIKIIQIWSAVHSKGSIIQRPLNSSPNGICSQFRVDGFYQREISLHFLHTPDCLWINITCNRNCLIEENIHCKCNIVSKDIYCTWIIFSVYDTVFGRKSFFNKLTWIWINFSECAYSLKILQCTWVNRSGFLPKTLKRIHSQM